MSLIRRRKSDEIKPRRIGDEDFYCLSDAARRLGFSPAKLRQGLHSRRFPFGWAKDGDTETSPIYVSAKDVEIYKRAKEREFQRRLEMNAQI